MKKTNPDDKYCLSASHLDWNTGLIDCTFICCFLILVGWGFFVVSLVLGFLLVDCLGFCVCVWFGLLCFSQGNRNQFVYRRD